MLSLLVNNYDLENSCDIIVATEKMTTSMSDKKTIPEAEFKKLTQHLQATPQSCQAPFRIYLDVDGVIQPVIPARELLELPAYIPATLFKNTYWDPVTVKEGRFYYHPDVIERLAGLSKRTDVDVVWLTSWMESAPYSLDKPLGIQSAGFLQWQDNRGDLSYYQPNKGHAILLDQEVNPSKFVWVDDKANRTTEAQPDYFTHSRRVQNGQAPDLYDRSIPPAYEQVAEIESDQYLTVTTLPDVGLTMEDLDRIEEWIDLQK